MSRKITYDELYERFKNYGCTLLITQEEFDKLEGRKTHIPLKIKCQCGHEELKQYCHLDSYGSGILCNECVNKNVSIKNKENSVKNGQSTGNSIEDDATEFLIHKLNNKFFIKRTNDGCQADMILKPKEVKDNLWLKIQIKSKIKPSHVYSFHIDKKDYTDCVMVFICLSNSQIWILPYNVVQEKTGISIGKQTSKYDIYQVTTDFELYNKITDCYNNTQLFIEEECMKPISESHIKEYNYRLRREEKLNFIQFTQPTKQNMVYDFLINETKHQEKVTYNCNHTTGHRFTVARGTFKQYYKLGDCDYYWAWIPDSSIFYVFPEQKLFDYDLISTEEKLGHPQTYLYPYLTQEQLYKKKIKSSWTHDYRFDLDNLNKEKLLQLLGLSDTKQEPMKFTLNQSTVRKCTDCSNNVPITSTRCETCTEILKLSFIKTEPTPVPKEKPEKVILKKSIDTTTTPRTEEFNLREPKKEISSNNIFSNEWNLFDKAFNKKFRSKRK